MCYLKHLSVVAESNTIFDKEVKEEISEVSVTQNSHVELPGFLLQVPSFGDGSFSARLDALISKVRANNSLIASIGQKIETEEQLSAVGEVAEMADEQPAKVAKDEILVKLFGDLSSNFLESAFKFKISLDATLPSKFYKHRKYSIGVKLMPCTPRASKIILSSNPVNICIGIFDKDGNWVHENLLGEPILEGITQVSLYQGRAEFSRLLFNEISSNFPKQKLNIAIYAKPGLDNLANNAHSGPNFVSWSSVKPLILKNVTILSKKRKKISDDLL